MFGDVVNEMKKAVEEKDRPKFVEFQHFDGSRMKVNSKAIVSVVVEVKPNQTTVVFGNGSQALLLVSYSEFFKKMGWD